MKGRFHMTKPKVILKQSFQVVGYSFKANLKEIEEKQLGKKTLEKLKANQDKIPHKIGNAIYLIQLYPMKENFNANKDPFTQIIGYKVSNVDDIPKDAILHHVQENDYVAYTHQGLESELQTSYDYLYGKWLDENNYYSLGYDIEIWDDRYHPEEPTNEIDMLIPIKIKRN